MDNVYLEKLKQSEEKYRYLFNNSPGLNIIWDLEELKILEISDNVLEAYGYSRDEFIGMSVKQYRSKEFHVDIETFAIRMLEGNEMKSRNTWIHLNKKGEEMYMDISSHKIDYNGRKAILSIAVNVTESIKAEQKLLNANENIRNLSTRLETIRDEERLNLSRELHDEIGQRLTVISLHFSSLNDYLSSNNLINSETESFLNNITKAIDGSVNSVRRISSHLRGTVLEDKTIIEAIQSQCEQLKESTGIESTILVSSEIKNLELRQELSIAIFRIFQESITNIIKYANAKKVHITLSTNGNNFLLKITDNGKGFDEGTKRKNSLGLIGMKERASVFGGNVSIESALGKGTKIELSVPIENTMN